MYTALISPRQADHLEKAASRRGGFVMRGLTAEPPRNADSAHWYYALLPGQPENHPEILPYPAAEMIAALEAERARYHAMARRHPDTMWEDAIRALDDMLSRLRGNPQGDTRAPVAASA